jgi:hypothetical protein
VNWLFALWASVRVGVTDARDKRSGRKNKLKTGKCRSKTNTKTKPLTYTQSRVRAPHLQVSVAVALTHCLAFLLHSGLVGLRTPEPLEIVQHSHQLAAKAIIVTIAIATTIFFEDYDTPLTLDLTLALGFGLLLDVYLAPEILARLRVVDEARGANIWREVWRQKLARR